MEHPMRIVFDTYLTVNIPLWLAIITIALPCVIFYFQQTRKLWMKESKAHEPARWFEVSDSQEEKILPRYHYHQSLLNDWIKKGVKSFPEIDGMMCKKCRIIVGGNIDMKQKKGFLSNFKPKKDAANYTYLNEDFQTKNGTDIFIVYFFNSSLLDLNGTMKKIEDYISFNHGTVLFAVKDNFINNDNLKEEMKKAAEAFGITNVYFVEESRSNIINEMTCILENTMVAKLEDIKRNLLQIPSSRSVNSSLLKVNALIMRLKKATSPTSITDKDRITTFTTTGNNNVDQLLERFRGEILYQKYDGRKLYVIAKDETVKRKLEDNFKIERMDLQIVIKNKLPVKRLTERGVPLHGAKFVHRDNGVTSFDTDPSYATTGSLMMANEDSLVAITSRHAFENNEYVPIYTLIDNQLLRLGGQIPQLQNNMEYLHDDITLVRIEDTVLQLVDENCEKLLIHENVPFPAKISSGNLELGDIVHKRGANTKLTTGVVVNINTQAVGTFCKPSLVILIAGDDGEPFADCGDSGSLVYKTSSQSSEENILEVYAMVHGKVDDREVDGPPDVVCFPMKDGCDTLYKNVFLLRSLKFCDR